MPTIKLLTKEEVLDKINKGKSFEDVEIGDVDFSKFSFDKPVNFDGAIFKGNTNFSSATFKKVTFRFAKFEGETRFDSVNFEGETYFSYAKFKGQTHFESTTFKTVSFSDTIFEGVTYFSSAKFKIKAFFHFVKFEEVTYFFNTTFKKVTFRFAKFEGETYFYNAEFEGETYFSYSTFRNTVHFEDTRFNGNTSFYNTVFEDRAYFEGKKDLLGNENLCLNEVTDWSYVRFLKLKLIDFTSVDFSKCKLSYADFSSVNLVDIRWAMKKKRRIIYDEIENEKNINYPIVENVYRRLKKNYENSGDYPYAGDFHYGEMEMKRRAQNKFFRWFSLTTLYKIFSGYGEKVWLSVLWLVLFFLLFTFSYLFTGLESGTLLSVSGNHEIIEYNFAFDFRSDSVQEFFSDSYTALSHSFEVIFLKREKLFETFTNTGRIFEVLQVLSIMIFITLSILALKRKFHR